MPVYICRWPNGDFSAVNAASKARALDLLDEIDDPTGCEVFTVRNFAVHFHLDKDNADLSSLDRLPVVLDDFGEHTREILGTRLYPEFQKAFDEVSKVLSKLREPSSEEIQRVQACIKAALYSEALRSSVAKKRKRRKSDMGPSASRRIQ